MHKAIFTIIIPVHNGSSTIQKTISSIYSQKEINSVKEIIIINDGSSDDSLSKIKKFNQKTPKIKIINHLKSKGLSLSLNEAIKQSRTKFIITAHQDILIRGNLSLVILQKIIQNNPNFFYIYPTVCQPKKIWQKYNFWQKYLFASYVNTELDVPIEKFDCINRQKIIDIGLYNNHYFRTAGEDLDLIIRSQKKKLIYLKSKIKIIHLHNLDPKFSFKNLVKKEKQIAETKGTLLRLYGINIPNFKSFFREILVILLFIPKINIFALVLLSTYFLFHNWRMYQFIFQDIKALFLPCINFYLFFTNIIASTKAFIYKKQTI